MLPRSNLTDDLQFLHGYIDGGVGLPQLIEHLDTVVIISLIEFCCMHCGQFKMKMSTFFMALFEVEKSKSTILYFLLRCRDCKIFD